MAILMVLRTLSSSATQNAPSTTLPSKARLTSLKPAHTSTNLYAPLRLAMTLPWRMVSRLLNGLSKTVPRPTVLSLIHPMVWWWCQNWMRVVLICAISPNAPSPRPTARRWLPIIRSVFIAVSLKSVILPMPTVLLMTSIWKTKRLSAWFSNWMRCGRATMKRSRLSSPGITNPPKSSSPPADWSDIRSVSIVRRTCLTTVLTTSSIPAVLYGAFIPVQTLMVTVKFRMRLRPLPALPMSLILPASPILALRD